jgi:magnesium transporter
MKTERKHPQDKCHWIDLISPDKAELEAVIQAHKLPATAVEDCLEPEHLPKIEFFENCTFIITRHFDKTSTKDADTHQELTRKIAFFITENSIITIQRQEPEFWKKMVQDLSHKKCKSPQELVLNIIYWVFDSYDGFLNESTHQLEVLEGKVFHQNTGTRTLQTINHIKKRLSVVKHMLTNTQSVAHRFPINKETKTLVQDLKEELEAVIFRANSLVDESGNLLQLYISLASHRTNDIMRVLTIFSVFFMPLTFIVGVYGMNFTHMPELQTKYGYFVIWGVMIAVVVVIYLWFKNKGWLK